MTPNPTQQKGPAMHDPRTDPRACTICRCENVTDADEMLPSGVAPMVTCSNGHTTGGTPTAAYFAEHGGQRGRPTAALIAALYGDA